MTSLCVSLDTDTLFVSCLILFCKDYLSTGNAELCRVHSSPVHSPKGSNIRGWTRLKPGITGSPHVGDGGPWTWVWVSVLAQHLASYWCQPCQAPGDDPSTLCNPCGRPQGWVPGSTSGLCKPWQSFRGHTSIWEPSPFLICLPGLPVNLCFCLPVLIKLPGLLLQDFTAPDL